MTEKTQDQSLATPEGDNENIITVNGKTFDLSTADGRSQLKGYTEATSKLASQKANEAHELKKKIEPYQKFSLGQQIVDPIAVNQKIAQLREEGDIEGAAQLATELALQATGMLQSSRQQQEEDRFFNAYVKANPDKFKNISVEMAKNFVFSQFRDDIYDAEDKFGLIDRILEPHVSSAPDEPISTLGDTKPVAKAPEPKVEPQKSALDLILEDD